MPYVLVAIWIPCHTCLWLYGHCTCACGYMDPMPYVLVAIWIHATHCRCACGYMDPCHKTLILSESVYSWALESEFPHTTIFPYESAGKSLHVFITFEHTEGFVPASISSSLWSGVLLKLYEVWYPMKFKTTTSSGRSVQIWCVRIGVLSPLIYSVH